MTVKSIEPIDFFSEVNSYTYYMYILTSKYSDVTHTSFSYAKNI